MASFRSGIFTFRSLSLFARRGLAVGSRSLVRSAGAAAVPPRANRVSRPLISPAGLKFAFTAVISYI
jgi:hypothetical protein